MAKRHALRDTERPKRRTLVLGVLVLAAAAVAGLFPAGAAADARPIAPPAIAGVPALPGPVTTAPQAAGPIKLLKATPDSLHVGDTFMLSGTGLPPNQDFDVVWNTVNGSYVMNPLPTTVEFYTRQFDPVSVILARARTDASGRLSASLKVPNDFGELHDIYLAQNGVQIAKGGIRVARKVTIDRRRGPIGTPITVKVTGLGWKDYESTASIRYDNKYTGFISATATRGVGMGQFRAAGPVGVHTVEVNSASKTVPYLNTQQAPNPWVGWFRFRFTVTKDAGPPAAYLQFPNVEPRDTSSRTTQSGGLAAGVTAKLSSRSGPVQSKVDVSASGLTAGVPVTLTWGTAVGNRLAASGWSLIELPLGEAKPAADGTLSTSIDVPDNLGGWHAVRLNQQGKTVAELPFFVERSIAGVVPKSLKVKAGNVFTVHIKGIGWTELDNAVAVTYDNAYIGYACGFNSNGDIVIRLVATGGPGTHLIDLYPLIYQGKGLPPWLYTLPMLSYMRDAPGLALGYALPAMRFAIEVVK